MSEGLSIRVGREAPYAGSGLELWILDRGKRAYAELTLQEVDESMSVPPCLRIDMELGQKVMDDLWDCGLRPSEGSGSAGSLAATQSHLEDMRKLVFSFVEPLVMVKGAQAEVENV